MSYDPLAQMTIQELDAASRRVKTDVSAAIATGTMDRWRSLAAVAHVLALRSDPAAKYADFMQMNPSELSTALGYDAEDVDSDAAEDQIAVSANESAAEPDDDDADLTALSGSLDADQLGDSQDAPASGALDSGDLAAVELDPTVPAHG